MESIVVGFEKRLKWEFWVEKFRFEWKFFPRNQYIPQLASEIVIFNPRRLDHPVSYMTVQFELKPLTLDWTWTKF